MLMESGLTPPRRDARVGVDAAAGIQVEVRDLAPAPGGDRDAQGAGGRGPLGCGHVLEACMLSSTVISKGSLGARPSWLAPAQS